MTKRHRMSIFSDAEIRTATSARGNKQREAYLDDDRGAPATERLFGAKWPQASYIRMPLARIASASSAAGPLKVLPVPCRTNSTVPRSGRP
jgi:hypothetical protein